jgi:hypothetical protein
MKCRECGAEVPLLARPGPQREYCSSRCKTATHRARRASVSVRRGYYDRIAAAAAAQGKTMQALVEQALAPALGGAP